MFEFNNSPSSDTRWIPLAIIACFGLAGITLLISDRALQKIPTAPDIQECRTPVPHCEERETPWCACGPNASDGCEWVCARRVNGGGK